MEQNDKELKLAFNEKGETISPVLGSDVRNFLVDIDGTVTDDIPNEEPERMATCMMKVTSLLFSHRVQKNTVRLLKFG